MGLKYCGLKFDSELSIARIKKIANALWENNGKTRDEIAATLGISISMIAHYAAHMQREMMIHKGGYKGAKALYFLGPLVGPTVKRPRINGKFLEWEEQQKSNEPFVPFRNAIDELLFAKPVQSVGKCPHIKLPAALKSHHPAFGDTHARMLSLRAKL